MRAIQQWLLCGSNIHAAANWLYSSVEERYRLGTGLVDRHDFKLDGLNVLNYYLNNVGDKIKP